jgi:hypothetical protein
MTSSTQTPSAAGWASLADRLSKSGPKPRKPLSHGPWHRAMTAAPVDKAEYSPTGGASR